MGSLVTKKNANVTRKSANNQTNKENATMDLSAKYPVVAERAAKFGLSIKPEYTINETQLILGENPSWVRKMVTGYRGKDKTATPLLSARKDEAGVWQVSIESIASRLADTAEKKALREERFNDPTKFASYRQDRTESAIKRVARIAAEGLTPEESAALKALLEKLNVK